MPPRFHVPGDFARGAIARLPADEGEHLRRVLRLGPGATVRVFDGRGREWLAEVTQCDREAVAVRLGEPVAPPDEPAVPIVLAAAVLKGDAMDDVVRDAVMMGVAAIWPVVAARSASTLAVLRRADRAARWRRVAVASAKQCGRAVLPEVGDPVGLAEALDRPAAGLRRFVLVEPSAAGAAPVRVDALGPARPAGAALLVGPEGGWTASELDGARAAGWTPVSLGARTLRAVSVPIVALTALSVLWRDL